MLSNMNNSNEPTQRRERKISASLLRRIFSDMAENLTEGIDTVTLALSGNTFEIHLDGGSINITINEKGGQA